MIERLISDPSLVSRVEHAWDEISQEFEAAYADMSTKHMDRTELSFHPFVKLLGFLCLELAPLPGDVVEIGVWKGKSLALMRRLTGPPAKVIGVDPCELEGQYDELSHFRQAIFPESEIIAGYSQLSIEKVLDISMQFKLLHIDGGHSGENVWMDFLMYERFVVADGFVVFDDYQDHEYCPEVGPTVDKMHRLGIFEDYRVIGSVPGYENSFVLRKLRRTAGIP